MNITDEMSGLEALMEAAEKQNEEKKDIIEQGMTCSMDEGCISCSG